MVNVVHLWYRANVAGRIAVLDDALIDRIAAGEVVERPSSVVKELIENAIDAGAARIHIDYEDGGRARVVVSDDGIGMSADDARLCVVRHATSKISRYEDLSNLHTLGFRGEALPSIAAVSRFTLRTRQHNDNLGTEVTVDGDTTVDRPVGCAPGTSVEARDLFFNVPARRKFLKARQTEAARIQQTCLRAALGHPHIAFVVSTAGRTVRRFSATQSLRDRARQAFGDLALVQITAERNGVGLVAALSSTEEARRGARSLHLFVNNRPIDEPRLARAIAFGFGQPLQPGHYPQGAVWLTLDPQEVDFNAHPNKTEVRFTKGTLLFDTVTRIIAAKLHTTPWERRPPELPSVGESTAAYGRTTQDARSTVIGPTVLGQLRDMFIVCASNDGLRIIDQHAAHETLLLRQLTEAHAQSALRSQPLLFPERMELTATRTAVAQNRRGLMLGLGLDIDLLSQSTAVVRQVPALVAHASPARVANAALDAADDNDPDAILAAIACAAAHRTGQSLSRQQSADLVTQIETSSPLAHQLHRTPIVMRIGFDELEARLGQ